MNTNPEPGTRNLEPTCSVLIAGVSTRAAAESAARAGFDVIALDAYADLDQHPSVRAVSLPRDFGTAFSPDAIVAAARGIASDAVVYLSSLENHPRAVEALAAGRTLWGCTPDALRQVRNPRTLTAAVTRHGMPAPHVFTAAEANSHDLAHSAHQWILKPCMSGGGHGVRLWHREEPVPLRHYLQQFVDGVPASVVFVAANGRGTAIGMSRQLVGENAFGAEGFRYCGNILNASIERDTAAAATALVDAVTAAFPLAGVGSIDVIAADSGLWPVEVNPRWSASMELVERARGVSMVGIHVDACVRAMLPPLDLRLPPARGTHGKAVVFARADVVVGNTRPWLDDPSGRDVPRPGDRIAVGQPICTVLAVGSDEADCHAMLVERAERIYGELSTSQPSHRQESD